MFHFASQRKHVLEEEKELKARIVELKQTFKIVAFLDQMSDFKVIPHDDIGNFAPYIYMFGASREMMAAVPHTPKQRLMW